MSTAQEHAERIARLREYAAQEEWELSDGKTLTSNRGVLMLSAADALTTLLSERTALLARVGELEGALRGVRDALNVEEGEADLPNLIHMLRSWEAESSAKSERIGKHLENVIEIADTWRPNYATKMDRDTIDNARAALKGQP